MSILTPNLTSMSERINSHFNSQLRKNSHFNSLLEKSEANKLPIQLPFEKNSK